MRIRTRHRLFKGIIVLGILVFLLSLYDMFANDAEWQAMILIAYIVLVVAALILYLGHKPDLDLEEPIVAEELVAHPVDEPPSPLPVEEAIEVEEVAKRRPIATGAVQGPHAFRCPFCSQVFGLEATHLRRSNDFRMNCPYCANSIRVPRAPKIAAGDLKPLRAPRSMDQLLYSCEQCGEVLRFTAPNSRLERALNVTTCPNCQSPAVALAAT